MLIYNILKKYIDMIDWERGIFSYYSMMVFENYFIMWAMKCFIQIMPIPVKIKTLCLLKYIVYWTII